MLLVINTRIFDRLEVQLHVLFGQVLNFLGYISLCFTYNYVNVVTQKSLFFSFKKIMIYLITIV